MPEGQEIINRVFIGGLARDVSLIRLNLKVNKSESFLFVQFLLTKLLFQFKFALRI